MNFQLALHRIIMPFVIERSLPAMVPFWCKGSWYILPCIIPGLRRFGSKFWVYFQIAEGLRLVYLPRPLWKWEYRYWSHSLCASGSTDGVFYVYILCMFQGNICFNKIQRMVFSKHLILLALLNNWTMWKRHIIFSSCWEWELNP